jgi:transposase-like protein
MMYGRFPLPLRNVEYLLFKRGIDLCHETVRIRWNNVHDHFNHERHLVDRQTYKERRSVARAEWPSVMG